MLTLGVASPAGAITPPAIAAASPHLAAAKVMPGEVIVVTGASPALRGKVLLLQASVHRTWVTIASAKATSAGRYTLRAHAGELTGRSIIRVQTGAIKAHAAKNTAAVGKPLTLTVVAQRVRLQAPRTAQLHSMIIITTVASPARRGRGVTLQRLVGRRWVTAARSTENAKGVSSFRLPAGSELTVLRLRAVVAARAGAASASSAPASVSTTPEPAPAPRPLPTLRPTPIVRPTAYPTTRVTFTPTPRPVVSRSPLVIPKASRTPIPTATPAPTQTPAALPHITTPILPAATLHQPYATTLAASVPQAQVIWSPLAALPPGLFLTESGEVHGRPLTTGPLDVYVEADFGSTQESAHLHLDVAVPQTPLVSWTTLPTIELGVPYRAALDIVGGVAPYTVTLASGALPNGLTLDVSGVVSGATTAIPGTFSVRVRDSAGNTTVTPILLPSQPVSAGWTQPRHDAGGSAYAGGDQSPTSADVGLLHNEWTRSAATHSVAVQRGIAFMTVDSGAGATALIAVDVLTGRSIWNAPLGACTGARVELSETSVVVLCGTHLRAFKRADGTPAWPSAAAPEATSGFTFASDWVIGWSSSAVTAYAPATCHGSTSSRLSL